MYVCMYANEPKGLKLINNYNYSLFCYPTIFQTIQMLIKGTGFKCIQKYSSEIIMPYPNNVYSAVLIFTGFWRNACK